MTNQSDLLSQEGREFAIMYSRLPADKQAAAADLIHFAIANPDCGDLLAEALEKHLDITEVVDHIKRETVLDELQKH